MPRRPRVPPFNAPTLKLFNPSELRTCGGFPVAGTVGLFPIVCLPIQSVSSVMMLLGHSEQKGGNNASTQIHSNQFMHAHYDVIQIGNMENGRWPHGSGAASRIFAHSNQQA